MRTLILCLVFMATLQGWSSPDQSKPSRHETRSICGWTVRVDERLTATKEAALALLEARLVALAGVMSEKPLARLREVIIQIDLTHGELRSMQYHPSARWLKQHGYDTNLAKCVHIPNASYFASRYETFRQPMAVLHELAHAYHDQVLGFDDERIKASWLKFKEDKRFAKVLMNTGDRREHYGRANAREFFAEMTEAYFGQNDFFPFVAGELKNELPEVFALMNEIWGPLPEREKAK